MPKIFRAKAGNASHQREARQQILSLKKGVSAYTLVANYRFEQRRILDQPGEAEVREQVPEIQLELGVQRAVERHSKAALSNAMFRMYSDI